MGELANEVFEQEGLAKMIFGYLPRKDLVVAQLTCRLFRATIDNHKRDLVVEWPAMGSICTSNQRLVEFDLTADENMDIRWEVKYVTVSRKGNIAVFLLRSTSTGDAVVRIFDRISGLVCQMLSCVVFEPSISDDGRIIFVAPPPGQRESDHVHIRALDGQGNYRPIMCTDSQGLIMIRTWEEGNETRHYFTTIKRKEHFLNVAISASNDMVFIGQSVKVVNGLVDLKCFEVGKRKNTDVVSSTKLFTKMAVNNMTDRVALVDVQCMNKLVAVLIRPEHGLLSSITFLRIDDPNEKREVSFTNLFKLIDFELLPPFLREIALSNSIDDPSNFVRVDNIGSIKASQSRSYLCLYLFPAGLVFRFREVATTSDMQEVSDIAWSESTAYNNSLREFPFCPRSIIYHGDGMAMVESNVRLPIAGYLVNNAVYPCKVARITFDEGGNREIRDVEDFPRCDVVEESDLFFRDVMSIMN